MVHAQRALSRTARPTPVTTFGMRGSRTAEVAVLPRRRGVVEVALVNLGRLVWRLVAALLRHPVLTGAVVIVAWAVHSWGPQVVGGILLALGAGLGVARRRWPDRFERHVGRRVRAGWRRAWVYARHWQPAMVLSGLANRFGDREWLPRLRRVRSTRWGDAVLVDLLAGQAPEDFERAADALAHTFGAASCRVRVDRPGRVWLFFGRADCLVPVLPAVPVPIRADPSRVVVGVAESPEGSAPEPWALRLLGTHVLIAGATGSGKGSVLWSLVRGLAAGVRDGSVQLWAVDPKGGMELTPGARMFTRFAYANPASMVELLEDAVTVMLARTERLRNAGLRLHAPTAADPLIVIVVDELAALVAYGSDRETRKRAEAALTLLLSQGRAPGVVVVAAVQDPGKDVVAFRDLFPVRVALRLIEDVQVDMVLGRSARARGAECDRIPPSLPGVGYVVVEGVREPVRVRAAYVSDDELRAMAAAYPAPEPNDLIRLADLDGAA